jgi:hypothetical protein
LHAEGGISKATLQFLQSKLPLYGKVSDLHGMSFEEVLEGVADGRSVLEDDGEVYCQLRMMHYVANTLVKNIDAHLYDWRNWKLHHEAYVKEQREGREDAQVLRDANAGKTGVEESGLATKALPQLDSLKEADVRAATSGRHGKEAPEKEPLFPAKMGSCATPKKGAIHASCLSAAPQAVSNVAGGQWQACRRSHVRDGPSSAPPLNVGDRLGRSADSPLSFSIFNRIPLSTRGILGSLDFEARRREGRVPGAYVHCIILNKPCKERACRGVAWLAD